MLEKKLLFNKKGFVVWVKPDTEISVTSVVEFWRKVSSVFLLKLALFSNFTFKNRFSKLKLLNENLLLKNSDTSWHWRFTLWIRLMYFHCLSGIGYSIGWKYWPFWVSVLVLDLNQNSGFGCTLDKFLQKSGGRAIFPPCPPGSTGPGKYECGIFYGLMMHALETRT